MVTLRKLLPTSQSTCSQHTIHIILTPPPTYSPLNTPLHPLVQTAYHPAPLLFSRHLTPTHSTPSAQLNCLLLLPEPESWPHTMRVPPNRSAKTQIPNQTLIALKKRNKSIWTNCLVRRRTPDTRIILTPNHQMRGNHSVPQSCNPSITSNNTSKPSLHLYRMKLQTSKDKISMPHTSTMLIPPIIQNPKSQQQPSL